jgi:uncharacterized protein
LRILVSGSSGLIGSALARRLAEAGHQVVRLVRRPGNSASQEVVWNPYAKVIASGSLDGFDAVVHLAGKNLAEGRWTTQNKKEIPESRSIPTQFLAEQLGGLSAPPKIFICASAVGIYGDRGNEILSEASGGGTGFLSEVCRAWEEACEPARRAEIRTVNLRIGMVLTADGGALPRMALPFRLGLGGKLGSGRQYMSWVTLEDLVSIIECALATNELSGPVNAVSPNPVTNAEFTRALGHALHRPAFFTAPAFALRLLLGEKADGLLLTGARVVPEKLLKAGFAFADPEISQALERILIRYR